MDQLADAIPGPKWEDYPGSINLRKGDPVYFGGALYRVESVYAQPAAFIQDHIAGRLFLQIELIPEVKK